MLTEILNFRIRICSISSAYLLKQASFWLLFDSFGENVAQIAAYFFQPL